MSMQFDPVPATPEQPPVTVSVVETPREPLAVAVNVWPIWPAPAAVDCVGGKETAVITRPAVQPAQDITMPGTKGREFALRPPVKVIVEPDMAPVALAAKVFPISKHGAAIADVSQPTASALTRSSVGSEALDGVVSPPQISAAQRDASRRPPVNPIFGWTLIPSEPFTPPGGCSTSLSSIGPA